MELKSALLGISLRRIPRMDKTEPNQMKHSTDTKQVFAALVKAQAEMPTAPKDGNNPHFKSKYATLQSIAETAKPILQKHGLAICQTFETACDGVSIITSLVHESGEYITGSLFLKPTKNDPQGYGSAITYGRRYAMAAILGIVADEDDDANAASAPVSETRTNAPSDKPWLNKDEPKWKEACEWLAAKAAEGKGEEGLKAITERLQLSFKINSVMKASLLAISRGGVTV
jgi:hypothetical protein